MKYLIAILLCSLSIFFVVCNNTSETKPLEVSIERFDQKLMNFKSKPELQEFLLANPWYTRDLYRAFPDDTAFVSHLYYIISHPGTQGFYKEVDSTFGDLSDIKQQFGEAFAHIKEIYPDFVPPKIYTTFTGLENDLYVSDSTIIISLEAFVGPDASYRPDQPEYIIRRYEKQYIVPSIIRLMASKYIKSGGEPTMLNDMLYFGKSFEFTKQVMPETADSIIIAMPDSSLRNNWYAQDLIWAHYIDKNLLYEQNQRVKEKYLGERPKTPEMGTAVPGRIGQWLGWRIIDKFRQENPDVSFKQLMEWTDAAELLRKSKYRGEVEE